MLKLYFLLCFLLISWFAIGQTSVNTTGKQIAGNNGSVEFSIGEIFGNYSSSSTGSVKCGVIQPMLSVPTAVSNPLQPNIRVFPNPVILTNLNIENPVYQNATLIIMDLLGQLVLQKSLYSGTSQIDLSGLTKGAYIVRVFSRQNILVYSNKLLKL